MSIDYLAHFDALAKRLPRLRDMAAKLETPNTEDDLCTRMGIVGFSYHSPTEEWGINHLRFLREYREHRSALADDIENGVIFCCLCIGYLLGLFHAGALDENEFGVAEAQLAGFLAMHRERISEALHM